MDGNSLELFWAWTKHSLHLSSNALSSDFPRQRNIQPQKVISPHPTLLGVLNKLYGVEAGGGGGNAKFLANGNAEWLRLCDIFRRKRQVPLRTEHPLQR